MSAVKIAAVLFGVVIAASANGAAEYKVSGEMANVLKSANERSEKNAADIGSANGKISANEGKIKKNADDIAALDGRVSSAEGDIDELESEVKKNAKSADNAMAEAQRVGSEVDSLEVEVSENEKMIDRNTKIIGVSGDGVGRSLGQEIDELDEAVAKLEKDLEAQAKKSDSAFQYAGEIVPKRNYALPNQVINFRGRKQYELKLSIKPRGKASGLRSVLHIGGSKSILSPALYLRHSSSKLAVCQQGRYGSRVWGNGGCNTGELAINQWSEFKMVVAQSEIRVFFNGKLSCSATRVQMIAPAGSSQVFISDDQYNPADMVTLKSIDFKITQA